ncbi:peptide chain release factor N(5)-glutamine methyltransferase [Leuconostoc pseudomesenteroides]|uniref:peptide chain release factor N(5)-glutamine methyltransferase n=1 Tax=Leuconostoc pseudomesenteroides TaxID=33968 RepID=UPI00111F17B5|nr:peptide chain release factor N(5)-glutamine methyltransferase [Leuconostoc pseudomesenteroides]TOZ06449.1 peptide chain release factor N(5)-glutamine methyltransferase [Leuconostoc pseudomesenteroides]
MTDKHFDTPPQFSSSKPQANNQSGKLNAPKSFEWDDIKKPTDLSHVKISLIEAKKWALIELRQADMSEQDAKDNLDFLLSGALNINYGMLRANMSRQMPAALATIWPKWVSELVKNRPPQYILGHAPFFGREFLVDERVLIPRPETEELVDWILKDAGSGVQPVSVLDIGTGSGAIIETLMLENQRVRGFATDISDDALTVAQANAQRFELSFLHFAKSDVYNQLDGLVFDIIVSNPPYIATQDKHEMDASVLTFEPHNALFAEHDGLDIYERIAAGLDEHLTAHGRAYFEIGYQQGPAVVDMMQAALPNAKITLRQDFAGLDRMIRVEK